MIQKEKHSKMQNLEYTEMNLQNYFLLPRIRIDQVRNIFKLRTRMAPFGENFRGGKEYIVCPLCNEAFDNQEHAFKCEIIREHIDMKGVNMKDIYNNNITLETAETITKMLEIRKQLIEKQTANEAQLHPDRSAASNTNTPCMYYLDMD